MIYILLSIFCSSCLFLFFKFFETQKIDTFQAIVVNYLVASIFGFLRAESISENIVNQNWFTHALIIGVLFIFMFYAIAYTSQKIGPSVASVANKLSVVIPVFFAVVLYNDSVSFLKMAGIALALLGVYFATQKNSNQIQIKKWQGIILVAFLFVGNGFLDSYLNFIEKNYLSESNALSFTPLIFSAAFCVGITILFYKMVFLKNNLSAKSIIYGFFLGILNYGSIIFLIKSLQLPNVESSVVFPLNNIGIVVATSVSSFFIFKEKMSKKNVLGIFLSAVAILLITFSEVYNN
ncbi:MAG: EamA family transporter [Flavobacteriales bacterium]|nr:EamA family transporter [Flavobacteriales bacterium]